MSRIGEKKEKTAENDERRRGNGRKNAARFAVSDVGRKDENRQEKEKTPESVRQIKKLVKFVEVCQNIAGAFFGKGKRFLAQPSLILLFIL